MTVQKKVVAAVLLSLTAGLPASAFAQISADELVSVSLGNRSTINSISPSGKPIQAAYLGIVNNCETVAVVQRQRPPETYQRCRDGAIKQVGAGDVAPAWDDNNTSRQILRNTIAQACASGSQAMGYDAPYMIVARPERPPYVQVAVFYEGMVSELKEIAACR